jgi:presenilin-like A22 family membrane protease
MQKSLAFQNKEKIKLLFRNLFWETVFSFFIFGLSIFTANNLYKSVQVEQIPLPTVSFNRFLVYFFGATLFILFLVFLPKLKKAKGRIYRFLFIFTSAYGCLIVFSLFLPDIIALALIIFLMFWWLRSSSILSHNLLMGIGLAGIGASLGLSFKPEVLVLILLILSVYDFIAVYKTKHMIKMAKSMIEAGVVMGLIIPKRLNEFSEKTKQVKTGGKFMILGGGDIAFPLILTISLIPYGIVNSIIVAVFSLIGISFSFLIFSLQKERKPMPALPPIALFSIIGFLITKII